jgi:hypothetical protein
VTNQVGVSWIDETRGLAAVDSLSEGAIKEGILDIELLNRSVMGDCSGKSGALSETPNDPASLVAIECPVGMKLVREDPFVGDDVGALR